MAKGNLIYNQIIESSELNSVDKKIGQILFTTDTKKIYLDQDTDTRIELLPFLSIYPIGSVYITTTSVNPGDFLGGTWESFGSGRTLIGIDINDADFDTLLETGGSKIVSLTTAQLPSHNHSFSGTAVSHSHTFTGTTASHNHTFTGTAEAHSHIYTRRAIWDADVLSSASFRGYSDNSYSGRYTSSAATQTATITPKGTIANKSITPSGTISNTSITPVGSIGNTGSGNAHNNLPPYIVVYFWRRTA